MARHKWTEEQVQFLWENVVGHSHKDLMKMINERFGLRLTCLQITNAICRRGLNNGLKVYSQKSNRVYKQKPIGAEMDSGRGYVEVKFTNIPGGYKKNWKRKNIVLWEAANGPVPPGHVVMFGDGNRQNFELDNLILVSKRQLSELCKRRLIKNDIALTKTGIAIADMYLKIAERKKEGEVHAN